MPRCARTVAVALEALLTNTPQGWGSLMCALFLFCGVQLLTVGLLGEYVGRLYLTTNRRPQSVVREVVRGEPARGGPAVSATAGAQRSAIGRSP